MPTNTGEEKSLHLRHLRRNHTKEPNRHPTTGLAAKNMGYHHEIFPSDIPIRQGRVQVPFETQHERWESAPRGNAEDGLGRREEATVEGERRQRRPAALSAYGRRHSDVTSRFSQAAQSSGTTSRGGGASFFAENLAPGIGGCCVAKDCRNGTQVFGKRIGAEPS